MGDIEGAKEEKGGAGGISLDIYPVRLLERLEKKTIEFRDHQRICILKTIRER
ncbi:MAG: hypothetical protein ABSH06_04045 [Thermodesulfobacteriota bacterium]|jgi:hypothetical protein